MCLLNSRRTADQSSAKGGVGRVVNGAVEEAWHAEVGGNVHQEAGGGFYGGLGDGLSLKAKESAQDAAAAWRRYEQHQQHHHERHAQHQQVSGTCAEPPMTLKGGYEEEYNSASDMDLSDGFKEAGGEGQALGGEGWAAILEEEMQDQEADGVEGEKVAVNARQAKEVPDGGSKSEHGGSESARIDVGHEDGTQGTEEDAAGEEEEEPGGIGRANIDAGHKDGTEDTEEEERQGEQGEENEGEKDGMSCTTPPWRVPQRRLCYYGSHLSPTLLSSLVSTLFLVQM